MWCLIKEVLIYIRFKSRVLYLFSYMLDINVKSIGVRNENRKKVLEMLMVVV